MRIAKDINGKSIWISSKKEAYCPICGDKLIIKEGPIISAHYSHLPKSTCGVHTGDISEWHLIWQSKFENIEVTTNDKKNRADAKLPNGLYLEFQNSPININVMRQREKAYDKLFWIFNIIGKVELFKDKIYWKLPRLGFLYYSKPGFFHIENDKLMQFKYIDFNHKETQYKKAEKTLIAEYETYTVNQFIDFCNRIDSYYSFKTEFHIQSHRYDSTKRTWINVY